MSKRTRRDFVKTSAVASAGFWAAGGIALADSKSPNEQLAVGCIGVGGKGGSDSSNIASGNKVICFSEVDGKRSDGAKKKLATDEAFTDYRKMFDKFGEKLDAITISTPDHTHGPATLQALRLGIACYTQKPLVRTIYESRVVKKVAAEAKVATQMGNQGLASSKLREGVAAIRAGAVGDVKEVHTWSNRPIWPQGPREPVPSECPEDLAWNDWLSCAKRRPYAKDYHPFAWRGWWDFGCGALGDMGCHIMSLPIFGLELYNPTKLKATTSGHNRVSFPSWSKIEMEFPKTEKRGAVKFFWHDGGMLPPRDLLAGNKPDKNGVLIVGSKGTFLSGSYGANPKYLEGAELPEVEYEKSPGHMQEFIAAVKGGKTTPLSDFVTCACDLTETVLLGNLAVWGAMKANEEVEVAWDSENMKATGTDGLDALITPEYHNGYRLN